MHQWNRRTWLRLTALECRSVPATFVVGNANDAGAGSLRQAITDANAAAAGDVITFDPIAFASPQTINLLSALPNITDSVTVVGPGVAKLTVQRFASAATNFRVFTVDNGLGSAIDVTLSGMTVSGGKLTAGNGGGIFVENERLTLDTVKVSGNQTSGQGGGIGVATDGVVVVRDSTVSGNQALGTSASGRGGGIYFAYNGGLTLERSTISGNQSKDAGGGVYLYAGQNITWIMRNSTISGNSTTASGKGGGIAVYGGGLQVVILQSTTVVNNSAVGGGGGIGTDGGAPGFALESSIVANNLTSGTGPDFFTISPVSAKNSAIGDTNGIFLTDLGGNVAPGTPLNLGPLANNGGPTQTHLPSAGPLVDAGLNSAGAATDQRGLARIAGSGADIGSVEVNGATITTPTAQLLGAPSVGPIAGGTVYQIVVRFTDDSAISAASIDVGDISVSGPGGALAVTATALDVPGDGTPRAAIYTLTPPGGSWDAADNGSYTITLNAAQVQDTSTNFVAAGSIGTFNVNIVPPLTFVVDEVSDTDDGDVTVGHLSLREAIRRSNENAFATDTISFGAVFNAAQSILVGSVMKLSESVVVNAPGARLTLDGQGLTQILQVDGAGTVKTGFTKLAFTNGKTSGNAFVAQGGAIFIGGEEDVTFTDCVFTGSAADVNGGALWHTGSGTPGIAKLAVVNCTFENNNMVGAGFLGGALAMNPNVTATITGTTFKNNFSAGVGGALGLFGDTMTVAGCTFLGNSAPNDRGGVVYMQSANTFTVQDTTMTGNTGNRGAAIYSRDTSTVAVINSTLSGNTATEIGGGVSFFGGAGAKLTIRGSTLDTNASTIGGGVFVQGAIVVTIENSTLSANEQTGTGGAGGGLAFFGFSTVGASFTMRNSTVTLNKANGTDGGGIHLDRVANTPVIESSIIAGNFHTANTSPDFFGPATVNGSNNLVGALPTVAVAFTGTGNQTGTIALPLDAKLGPLATNGGPTMTHALLAGSPALDAGNNLAGLAFDQRGTGFNRVSGKSADVGAFEVQLPPRVQTVQVNDGSAQRSRVTSLRVSFDSHVNFSGLPAAAFQLIRQSDNAVVTLSATVDDSGAGTVVTLTFTGGAVDSNSLADGRYTLTVSGTQVSNANGSLDGDGNGTGGDNFVLVGDPAVAPKLYRLFGDSDGDNDVDTTDFGAFRGVFGAASNVFDFDNDGDVDTSDFGAFRIRFGGSI